jgi:ElaB/YqjD/DUF883 family membrane-anchored ribosome-binding protein
VIDYACTFYFVHMTGGNMATAKKTAKKVTKKATATIQAKGKVIARKAKVVAKKGDALAKKNPWALAGIAAGVGLAVGAAAALSTRPKKKK